MEMLSNIWNALSTENIEFINFISKPMVVVENFLVLLLFLNLLNIQCTNKQKLMYVTLVSLGRNYF